MATMWRGEHARRITTRILIEGDLILQTPAHFGNGDGSDATDMPLLLDPLDEADGHVTPLLTGASLAGALRNYLRELESGYRIESHAQSLCTLLFGGMQGDDDGEQSPLIVDDARGEHGAIELRDGVAINAESRTADGGKKYDLQLWAAGTRFPLRIELAIRKYDDKADQMRRALATALDGLSNGGITLGARKQRGYGAVTVENWRAQKFDLTTSTGLVDWLEKGGGHITEPASLASVLGTAWSPEEVQSDEFKLVATFALDGSLLIRSGGRSADRGPDAVHLAARPADRGDAKPALSGTSLAGALRARGLKILKTLSTGVQAKTMIDDIWGTDMEELRGRRKAGDKGAQPQASRLRVSEQIIEVDPARTNFVQNRVSIDRFTGGALDTALFNEQPVFGSNDSGLTLALTLRDAQDHEIGLLLLLLKDLWTGDLTLGGESSVGRGRLQGRSATLTRAGELLGKIEAVGATRQELKPSEGLAAKAETYVTKLKEQLATPKPKEEATK
jgi:CRISPR/Cas system CSM-associated protein Csm3 (group 7 of RAMP superfamily)